MIGCGGKLVYAAAQRQLVARECVCVRVSVPTQMDRKYVEMIQSVPVCQTRYQKHAMQYFRQDNCRQDQ